MTDFQKELAKIIQQHRFDVEKLLPAVAFVNAQQSINNLLSDAIGEDETHSPTVRTLHNHGIDARNDLRATIRSKLGLTGGSDE